MTTDGTFEPFDFFVKHNFLALIDKVLILARKVLISRSNKGSINLKKAILYNIKQAIFNPFWVH